MKTERSGPPTPRLLSARMMTEHHLPDGTWVLFKAKLRAGSDLAAYVNWLAGWVANGCPRDFQAPDDVIDWEVSCEERREVSRD